MKIIATTFVVLTMTGLSLQAAVIPVGIGAFTGSPQIDFGTTETGAPIDGQTINGVGFRFTIGGSESTAAVIDGGPGTTNNVTPANVEGPDGVLTLTFPQPENLFGFGYALLGSGTISAGTTIELFDARESLIGEESYTAVPDPSFPGGFAGIQSDTPFAQAVVSFTNSGYSAFAFDNVRFATVPEPSTLALLAVGAAGLLGCCWRRQAKAARSRSCDWSAAMDSDTHNREERLRGECECLPTVP
jgi:hypothetical protein